jgi:diacylglycerol kinase family enzyme
MAGERYFLLMAGIGFDGEVVRRAQSLERHKQRLGILPYVVSTLATAPLYRGADVELRYDGIIRRVQALMLVVGNTRLYGGYFRLTPNAVANDGWLDLCVIKGKGFLSLARQSLPILVSRSISYSDIELLRIKDLTVQGDEPLPLQVDGELIGTTPVRIQIAPKALNAIIPSQCTSDLIA